MIDDPRHGGAATAGLTQGGKRLPWAEEERADV
jgi:hypothetical protein